MKKEGAVLPEEHSIQSNTLEERLARALSHRVLVNKGSLTIELYHFPGGKELVIRSVFEEPISISLPECSVTDITNHIVHYCLPLLRPATILPAIVGSATLERALDVSRILV